MVEQVALADAAAWVRSALAGPAARGPGANRPGGAGTGPTRWVGIDGFGAAGKTTLADSVAAAVPGAVVVHVDDFARRGVRGWERDRFVAQVVEPLLSTRAARYQRWDFDADRGLAWVEVPAGVPVVVEGVSATDDRLPVPWDVTLWLDAPAELRWRRITERDDAGRLEHWLNDWLPSEQDYFRTQRPDLRVTAIVC